jgi:hypothetical protein
MNVDIKAMTVEQLKALAYDQISTAEQCRVNIQMLQTEIVSRAKQPADPITVGPVAVESAVVS